MFSIELPCTAKMYFFTTATARLQSGFKSFHNLCKMRVPSLGDEGSL